MRLWRSRPGFAVAFFLLAAIGLIALRAALDHLHAARRTGSALSAIIARTPALLVPLMAPADVMAARDQSGAQAGLDAVLRQIAMREGLLIEVMAADGEAKAPLAAVRIVVSGDAAHVLRFVEAVENRSPVVRFVRWRLASVGAGGSLLRLDGSAVAMWRR